MKQDYFSPTKKSGDVATRKHIAKTAKICACCAKEIKIDTLYIKRVGVHNRRFWSTHFHPNCYAYYRHSLMAMCNPYKAIKRA